ncbi:MAG: glutamate formimidoyltransferase [Bacteroidia bacterium]|jgi:glutamate formiminotransferase/formiminotetrahydrofolate cyclodeaminase|nr:glutamate formimidoyltransferase [Bacteroidia bacterium]
MDKHALIECVPNFSEGNDMSVIQSITSVIEQVEGVKLLDVDPGKATNRTVVTFVGHPDAVIEAAYRAIEQASKVIDMSKHKGEHPRMGATDVCPLIPVSGISMEETAAYAVQLAKRVGEQLSIPVYLYEAAQPNASRNNLSVIRAGEYEGFFDKIKLPEWKPDFGPAQMHVQAGATVIGARDFLIAYNVNLNTQSVRLANSIAFDVREAGRVKREGHPVTGKVVKDEAGNDVRIPGTLKAVKAIGWYIEEYKIAQISMNLINYKVTSVHQAFDEVCRSAQSRGVRVTGSELVGLIPLNALLDAGKHYLRKQGRSVGVSEAELIHIAVKSLGLDELAPFDPNQKIIEYKLRNAQNEKLIRMDLRSFANETASESPAPGGGSISAYAGTMGIALGNMVANLSAGKRGWEDQVTFFSDWAEKGQTLQASLLQIVDEDTAAFNAIMNAFGLPKQTDAEKAIRTSAIESATVYACEVPLRTMQLANAALDLLAAMIEKGNPNSITDAGVGVLCTVTAVKGAYLNVLVNAKSLKDKSRATTFITEATTILKQHEQRAAKLVQQVEAAVA